MNRTTVTLRVAAIALIVGCSLPVQGFGATATTGALILEIVPDARTAALGQTFVGIANDINSLFYNPAGLAQIKTLEVPMAKNYYMDDIDQQYIGIASDLRDVRTTNVKSMGAIAVNFVTLQTGDIVSRNDVGIAGAPFKARDQLITIGYGKTLYESSLAGNVMAGVSMKMYKTELQDAASQGQALDYGALWKVPGETLFVGLAVQNTGAQNKFLAEKYDLPSVVKLGVSGKLLNKSCLVGVDLKKPIHDAFNYSACTELWFKHTIALRLGFNSSTREAGNGISAGFGLCLLQTDIYFMYASEINIDYAFIPYGDLGDSHRLSLLLKIGAE